ncbi:hypothetical protein OH76DRAFT_1065529 [Lentinus brumalis]|uniref:Uncharacterized protein n=1 Tax=Lentinus brumalis TaxID=2498619 RepID=A0A371DNJ7_9APHY|nr:hypothetical protein OH76DRAFT_1065529 [Polyporus brumalis]
MTCPASPPPSELSSTRSFRSSPKIHSNCAVSRPRSRTERRAGTGPVSLRSPRHPLGNLRSLRFSVSFHTGCLVAYHCLLSGLPPVSFSISSKSPV